MARGSPEYGARSGTSMLLGDNSHMSSRSPINPAAFLRHALGARSSGSDEDEISEAILAAALQQFELFGISRTTMSDITKRSGLSRMTLYRRFDNKQAVIDAVLMRETQGFLTDLQAELDRHVAVEDKLTEGFLFTVVTLREHGLLNRLLESEPEVVVPHFTVNAATLVDVSSEFLAAEIVRSLADKRSHAELLVVSEVAVRLVISFVLTPSKNVDFDSPEAAREFARTHLGPLLGQGAKKRG